MDMSDKTPGEPSGPPSTPGKLDDIDSTLGAIVVIPRPCRQHGGSCYVGRAKMRRGSATTFVVIFEAAGTDAYRRALARGYEVVAPAPHVPEAACLCRGRMNPQCPVPEHAARARLAENH